jgi:hypothetical protein
LYKNGAGNPQAATAPPDYTGYSYTPTNWPSQYNAYADFKTKRTAYASYNNTNASTDPDTVGNPLTGLSVGNSFNVASPGPTGVLATSGSSRRIDVAPIVDCAGWAGSQTVPIIGWACILMLHPITAPGDLIYMEYIGLSNAPGTPCATTGLAGGPGSVGPLVPALVR